MSKHETLGKTQEERIAEIEARMDEVEREQRKQRATIDKLWKRQQLHDAAVKRARKEQEKRLVSEKKANRARVEAQSPEEAWEELKAEGEQHIADALNVHKNED